MLDLDLPRLHLARLPTPIQPLAVDCPARVWVKREDLAGELYGGNKVRKLEWLLPPAEVHGGQVLTVGARGSNHLLATALYGGALGLDVHGVVLPQPDSQHVRANFALLQERAASLWACPGEARLPACTAAAWLRVRRRTGHVPLFIPPGGSSPLGSIGWVEAGLEIGEQVAAGALPPPTDVFAALGSGGTVAGLLLGLKAAGLDARVHGVAVTARLFANRPLTLGLARATARLIRRAGGPALQVEPSRLVVHHRFLGEGYGHPTGPALRAMELAGERGLCLECTYTGKALAACLELAGRGAVGDRVLFVNTVSSRGLPPGPLP